MAQINNALQRVEIIINGINVSNDTGINLAAGLEDLIHFIRATFCNGD